MIDTNYEKIINAIEERKQYIKETESGMYRDGWINGLSDAIKIIKGRGA